MNTSTKATFLLKWNPKVFDWGDLPEDAEKIRRNGSIKMLWSCGNTKRIGIGDRVFLLRAKVKPRGLIASGTVIKPPFKWGRRQGHYVEVKFDALLNPLTECIFALERLQKGKLADGPWTIQGSGKTVPQKTAIVLEPEWRNFLKIRRQSSVIIAEEVLAPKSFPEGAIQKISVNKYERNPDARIRCILHYGCDCRICGFNFEKVYGELGAMFIHVHHLKPLAKIQKEYEVDPIKDLLPVCPNCHAMIHRGNEPLAINLLKRLIKKHHKPR